MRVTVNDRLFAEYPQPETHSDPAMNAAATTSRNDHWAICDRFRVFAKPSNGMNPQGMTQPKASIPPGTPCGACLGVNAVCAGTIIVTVLITGAPFRVTVAGLKLQVVP